MIVNFFILSPRGDTIIAKTYRQKSNSSISAHERSHTEAFFRKVKFWDGVAPGTPGMDTTLGLKSGANTGGGGMMMNGEGKKEEKKRGDAPPVFVMPDGYSYMHVKRNGLIFGCATEKNVSPVVVIEVSYCLFGCCLFLGEWFKCT
jgi:AP-4 complex subunit mu-1